MSRKLIFVKGLLMCYDCNAKELNNSEAVKSHLKNVVHTKPIPYIIEVLTENGIEKEKVAQMLDAYEEYFEIINNPEVRERWEEIKMEDLENDSDFNKARTISRDFQESLQNIFFESNTNLSNFTKKYVTF